MFGIEYRPLNFKEIIGLDNVKDILKASIRKERYAAGYLFQGVLSSGKTTLAQIFARAILCENKKYDMSPCNECKSCKDFLEGRHPGYSEIDSANNGGKDDIKEIKDSLAYESLSSYKIITFDECHNISTAGNNALLKQLEVPNKNVILIFCTTDAEKMDSALRSRCWPFRMSLPSEKQIFDKLVVICNDRKIKKEDSALSLIVRNSEQHFRIAENLLDMTSLLGDVTLKNVTASISFYDDIILEMFFNVSESLGKSLETLEFLVSRMETKDLYENVVKVLNDAIKYLNGIKTPIKEYNEVLELFTKKYGEDIFMVLDYIISKDRLKDSTFLQSDVILIHYKFLKKHFKAPEIEYTSSIPQEDSTGATKPVEKVLSIDEISKMESWDRAKYIRDFKSKQATKSAQGDLKDIKSSWGVEEAHKSVSKELINSSITISAFTKNVEGLLDGHI